MIEGGVRLEGVIPISGAKNAVLPLMAATLLTSEVLTLMNVPDLADIRTMAALLRHHGAAIALEGGRMTLQTPSIKDATAPYDLVRKMRASILVLGALLARHGHARVSLPGGCAIGTRPVDLHLKGMEALGAIITLEQGYVNAHAPHGLKGATITLPMVSVGATENIMLAACLAQGVTTLTNAAREPEIIDLAACLNAMGAKIAGAGTDTLTIDGVTSLHAAEHKVLPDRIEAGTYMLAAAITGGDVLCQGAKEEHLQALITKLREAGVSVDAQDDGVRVRASARSRGVDVMTEPHPAFPTDLQAQFMALMAVSDGAAMLTETIFENRFMHVPELCRMGANITVHGASALVRGVAQLTAAPVMATDLRASSSLVLAGLVAKGTTEVRRIYHLDRGYDSLDVKLRACGAQIRREPDSEGV